MNIPSATGRPALGSLLLLTVAATVGAYFAFAAVQGDYGVFRQVQIRAEIRGLTAERDRLAMELAAMQNLTKRLSDDYLDLDLLDEQARDVLGYQRADEIVIR
jgi:cell division protein FtsB